MSESRVWTILSGLLGFALAVGGAFAPPAHGAIFVCPAAGLRQCFGGPRCRGPSSHPVAELGFPHPGNLSGSRPR